MGYDYHWIKDAPAETEERLAQARALYHQALAERDAIPEEERGRWAPDTEEGVAGGSTRWREAWKRMMAASEEVDRANVDYFRLNVWGGGRYADVMRKLGMARSCQEPGRSDWDAIRRPDYLDDMPKGVDFYEAAYIVRKYLDDDEQMPAEILERLADDEMAAWEWLQADPQNRADVSLYVKDLHALLTAAPDSGSMWMHKIAGSNDGWINTPEEICSALAVYDELDPSRITQVLTEGGVTDLDYWGRWIEFLRGAAEHGGGFTTN